MFTILFVDCLQFLLKRRHLKNLKKSTNKVKNKKVKIMMKMKQFLWRTLFLNIKLVYFRFLLHFRRCYWIIKKTILKIISTEWTIIEFALLQNIYTSLKRPIDLKWIIKISLQNCILSSTTIHCRSLPLKFVEKVLKNVGYTNDFCSSGI